MVLIQMGLRAGSPSGSDRDNERVPDDVDRCPSGAGHQPAPTGRDWVRRQMRTPPLRYGSPPVPKLFGSVQEMAGNFAAGMQRIGFHCGFPWGRETRRRSSGRERVHPAPPSHAAIAADQELEETRRIAAEQIRQLSEQQIFGQL